MRGCGGPHGASGWLRGGRILPGESVEGLGI